MAALASHGDEPVGFGTQGDRGACFGCCRGGLVPTPALSPVFDRCHLGPRWCKRARELQGKRKSTPVLIISPKSFLPPRSPHRQMPVLQHHLRAVLFFFRPPPRPPRPTLPVLARRVVLLQLSRAGCALGICFSPESA